MPENGCTSGTSSLNTRGVIWNEGRDVRRPEAVEWCHTRSDTRLSGIRMHVRQRTYTAAPYLYIRCDPLERLFTALSARRGVDSCENSQHNSMRGSWPRQ